MTPEAFDISCSRHGQMRYRFAMCQWDCRGFDGEKCSARLTNEEVEGIVAGQPLARATGGEFGWVATFHGEGSVTLTSVVIYPDKEALEEAKKEFQ